MPSETLSESPHVTHSLAYTACAWPHPDSDTFPGGITALIGVPEVWSTIPSHITNRIPKETRPLICEVVWSIIMPVIAMWETLDFRPSSGTKKYKGENDCRKESEHIWQSLRATLIEGYHSLGPAAQTVNDEADARNQLAGMSTRLSHSLRPLSMLRHRRREWRGSSEGYQGGNRV